MAAAGAIPQTICTAFQAAFAVDSAGNNTFVTPVGTTTLPAGNTNQAIAIVPLLTSVASNNAADLIGKPIYNGLLLQPFGQGAAGNTFTLNVFGYKLGYVPGTNGVTSLTYCPMELASVTCTLGNAACPANSVYPGGASDLLCNSCVLGNNTQNSGVDATAIQPSGNNAAWVMIDTKGCPLIGFQCSTGNSNKVNLLWAPV